MSVKFPELAVALLVLALRLRMRDFVVRRPNLHKERISGGDDLFQWGPGRGVLEVPAPVGDEPYAVGELLLFVTRKLPKNARGEWGLRKKDRGGALEDRNHLVVVRDCVVREDQRIQKGKVRHQARGRKDVIQPCFAVPAVACVAGVLPEGGVL